MPRRRTNEREQVRAEQFAHALSHILHELHISHRDLAAALHISRYTVDSWTRVSDPALPSDQNLAPLCQFIEQQQRGSGAKLAAAAQFTWVPTNNEKVITSVLPSPNVSRHNLPAALTSFVGRDTELREVEHLLTVTRLLTLIGVGGVGKTRLALQLAQKVGGDFTDGVWLVELAALRDPSLLWQAIATAVGTQEPAGDSNHQLLTAYLQSKHLLLVLDNCEHLVGGCAQAVTALLCACPHLHILATSREVLGVAGEVLYYVLPLTPPRLPATGAQRTAEIAHSDAVRLFVERACAVQPRFALNDDNAQAVAHICQRLDGIPLALELAAARVRHLSPEQITERLNDRFQLLTGGSRTALPRQQTLRAALDWSHDLLSDAERVLFRRLSVFAGRWSLVAVEQVTAQAADVDLSRDLIGRNDVSDLLSALIDKSLVVVDASGSEARYHVLETIRAYAHEKCTAAGEVESVCNAHLAFFHQFVLNVKPLLYGAEQIRGFEQLDRELQNIQAALEWALTTQPMTLIEMADALQLYWQFWGSASEGFHWVKAAFGHAATLPSVDAVRVHANISRVLAELARMQGDNSLADSASAQAVALYRTLNDSTGLGIALCTHAFNSFEAHQFELAYSAAEEAIGLLRVSDDQFHLSYALGMLAVVLAALGDFGAAYQALQESTHSARTAGAPLVLSMALLSLASIDVQRGAYASARKPLEEAIMLFQATRNHHMLHAGRSLLADIARHCGDVHDAEALYHQVIVGWRERGHFGALARCIECLGFIAHAEGKNIRAVRLFVAAAHLRESTQAAMTEPEQSEYAQHMQQLQTKLGTAAFETVCGKSASLNVEQTVMLALNAAR